MKPEVPVSLAERRAHAQFHVDVASCKLLQLTNLAPVDPFDAQPIPRFEQARIRLGQFVDTNTRFLAETQQELSQGIYTLPDGKKISVINPNEIKILEELYTSPDRGMSTDLLTRKIYQKGLDKGYYDIPTARHLLVRTIHRINTVTFPRNHAPWEVKNSEKRGNKVVDGKKQGRLGSYYLSYNPERLTVYEQPKPEKPIVTITAKEAIDQMRNGVPVRWGTVPWPEVAKILELVAKETGQPVAILGMRDLYQPFTFLGGATLSGFYQHAANLSEREGKERMQFILEKSGFEIKAEDIISGIRNGRTIMWERAPSEAIRDLIGHVARERGKPLSMLYFQDLVQPCEFLDGYSLTGFADRIASQAREQNKGAIEFLLEQINVTATAEDVLAAMKNGNNILWNRLPNGEIGKILSMVAEELGKPVSMLNDDDLYRTPLAVAGNRSLRGLIRHGESSEKQTAMQDLLERAGIKPTVKDLVQYIKSGRHVYWDRILWAVTGDLLELAAKEIGLPVSMIDLTLLARSSFSFLDGKTLGGLYVHIGSHPERKEKDRMTFILEKIRMDMTVNEVIIRMQKGERVKWDRVPSAVIQDLLSKAGEELGIPANSLGFSELSQHLDLLNGHTLSGLYEYLRLQNLRQKAKVQIKRTVPRGEYCRAALHDLFAVTDIVSSSIEDLMPQLEAAAKLYTSSFKGITFEEALSEVISSVLEERANDSGQDIISGIYSRLQEFSRRKTEIAFREFSVNEIRDRVPAEKRALDEVLEMEETEIELNNRMRESMHGLSDLQKKLIAGVGIEGKTLEEMSEELEIDVVILDQEYTTTLSVIQSEFSPNY